MPSLSAWARRPAQSVSGSFSGSPIVSSSIAAHFTRAQNVQWRLRGSARNARFLRCANCTDGRTRECALRVLVFQLTSRSFRRDRGTVGRRPAGLAMHDRRCSAHIQSLQGTTANGLSAFRGTPPKQKAITPSACCTTQSAAFAERGHRNGHNRLGDHTVALFSNLLIPHWLPPGRHTN